MNSTPNNLAVLSVAAVARTSPQGTAPPSNLAAAGAFPAATAKNVVEARACIARNTKAAASIIALCDGSMMKPAIATSTSNPARMKVSTRHALWSSLSQARSMTKASATRDAATMTSINGKAGIPARVAMNGAL